MASQSGQIGRSVSPSGRAIVLKGAMNVCRGMLVEKGCVTLTHSSPDHRGHTTPRKELCCQGNVRSVIRGDQRAFLMHARDARRHARSDRVQFWNGAQPFRDCHFWHVWQLRDDVWPRVRDVPPPSRGVHIFGDCSLASPLETYLNYLPMKELRQVEGTRARDSTLCHNFMGRIFKCGKDP